MADTLTDLQTRRALVLSAYTKALEAQQYSVSGSSGGGRTVVRPDITKLGDELRAIDRQIASLSRGGVRIRQAVPRDH